MTLAHDRHGARIEAKFACDLSRRTAKRPQSPPNVGVAFWIECYARLR
jgi:hypothetical protein